MSPNSSRALVHGDCVNHSESFRKYFWGREGYEDLIKHLKNGSEFCKELANILQERADVENGYARSLSKLSQRLIKITRENVGSIYDCWHRIGIELATEVDAHRNFSLSLHDEIIKPMRNLAEIQNRARKTIEQKVDVIWKEYNEKKECDMKYRQKISALSKEIEKTDKQLQEHTALGKSITKVQSQLNKLNEALIRYDIKFHSSCENMELQRRKMETSICDAANQIELLDKDRVLELDALHQKYSIQIDNIFQIYKKLVNVLSSIKTNPLNDIQRVIDRYGRQHRTSTLLLYDIYGSDLKQPMNGDRRMESLNKWRNWISNDIERELKGRTGVRNLSRFYKQTNKMNKLIMENMFNSLTSNSTLLLLLEVSRYRIEKSIDQYHQMTSNTSPIDYKTLIDEKKEQQFRKLMHCIEQHRTKFPLSFSHLVIPVDENGQPTITHLFNLSRSSSMTPSTVSEFSLNETTSTRSESEQRSSISVNEKQLLCRAKYSFDARQTDELSFHCGDKIIITHQNDDEWWQGYLHGHKVDKPKFFPVKYIELIK
ncbi:hypothetical protein SNEBB_002965 [Seison nebaliae]|nr:hypothetical protein SNEBB_002965 [Seison nebaliae]